MEDRSPSIFKVDKTDVIQSSLLNSRGASGTHGCGAIHRQDLSCSTDALQYSAQVASRTTPDLDHRLTGLEPEVLKDRIALEQERPPCCIVDSGVPRIVPRHGVAMR